MSVEHNDLTDPLLPEVATVTVKSTVDGTVKRKGRGKAKPKAAHDTHSFTVDPRVMAEAKRQCHPNQRLVIVGPEEVWIVNKGSSLRPRRQS